MSHSFIKWFLVSVVAWTLFFVTLIFFVDPFGVYETAFIKGFNHQKSGNIGRFSVAFNIIKHKPKLIVLGTSRAAFGFDKETLRKYSQDEAFLNAGLAGASFDEIYSYFLHALHVQPDLKTVILGIDLYSFTKNRKFQNDFTEERLQTQNISFQDWKYSLFSRNALVATLDTFYQSCFKCKIGDPILEKGEKEYLKYLLSLEEFYKDYQLDLEKIQKFRSLEKICKANSIELKVFMSPLKAMYWDFYAQNGLTFHVEELKRELSAIHPLWDFSGFNSITTESFESEGNALYHECSHYTPYTGSLVLQRMYGEPSPSLAYVGDLLIAENLQIALEKEK